MPDSPWALLRGQGPLVGLKRTQISFGRRSLDRRALSELRLHSRFPRVLAGTVEPHPQLVHRHLVRASGDELDGEFERRVVVEHARFAQLLRPERSGFEHAARRACACRKGAYWAAKPELLSALRTRGTALFRFRLGRTPDPASGGESPIAV